MQWRLGLPKPRHLGRDRGFKANYLVTYSGLFLVQNQKESRARSHRMFRDSAFKTEVGCRKKKRKSRTEGGWEVWLE